MKKNYVASYFEPWKINLKNKPDSSNDITLTNRNTSSSNIDDLEPLLTHTHTHTNMRACG